MTFTVTVPVELPGDGAGFLGHSSQEALEVDLKRTLAVRLFEEGRLSLGKAAQMAGLHKVEFMEELGRRKVSVFNWDEEEMFREFGPPKT
jgi:predicted HTH domain antitoxin